MSGRRRRWRRVLHQMQPNLVVLVLLALLGAASFGLLRTELLKNAQDLGTSLAQSYASEERNNLTVYETLLTFGTESINSRVQEGNTAEELQEWISLYFERLEAVLGKNTVDPYLVLNGKIIAANPWEGDEDFDVEGAIWYQMARQADGEVIFTDAYTDSISGKPVITMAQMGNTPGTVLAFDIFPENLHFHNNPLTLPEGASFYLCDASGTVLYQQTDLDKSEEELQSYVGALVESIQRGEHDHYDSYIYDSSGQQRSVYYSIMPNGWLSVITVPYDTILRELEQFTDVFLAVLLLCLLGFLLMTWRDLRLSAKVERTNETVRVLGNSYYALYRVDLDQGTYEMIKGSDYVRQRLPQTGSYEELTEVISQVMEKDACKEYRESFSLPNVRKLVAKRIRDFGGDFQRLFGGVYRWVNVRVLFDESLAPGEVVLCFREVEEEKQHQLQERKLLENALESSRQSEKTKQAFFSNMSHDMRTPLNAIIGLTELARQHTEDPRRTDGYLEKIAVSGRQLLELINDILDMSRIEQGKVVLDYRQFDLKESIRECAEPFRLQAEGENKQFQLSFAVSNPVVLGDPLRISQIMNNLLSNALKFTGQGDSITVSVTQFQEETHAKYQIVVRDTGIGMSEEFLPQIFEPYARETRFTARKITGTGLGMPIVKNLVTEMNGQIQVESRLGAGTTFTLVLPLEAVRSQEVEKAEDQEPERESAQSAASGLTGRRILLAEDNEVNMEIATEILSGAGLEVTQAWNGQEAVEHFAASKPFFFDAILMDMQMPQMDGCTAAKQIRRMARPDAEKVPIIAVTANAFAEDIAATTAAGMNAHVSKPIDFPALLRKLEELTKRPEDGAAE